MRAVILAAGQGTRLRPLTNERPKCLVPLLGKPILQHILDSFRACNVTDVAVVTGYRADQIESLGQRTRHNPDYASTNMVHSLFCAREEMDDDLIICYGDIVFAPAILASLLRASGEFAVVVDREWRRLWQLRMPDPLSDAETLRVGANDRLLELGKKPESYDDIQGQYTGLIRIARSALSRVEVFYDGLDRSASYDGKDFQNMYMTSFIQAVIDRLMPVQAVWINGGWVEVDSNEDLQTYETHAREILPWLVAAEPDPPPTASD